MSQFTIRGISADLPVFEEEAGLEIRATGPVLFARCSLREAEFNGCDLAHSLFDDCDLALTGFGSGNYRGCDLRGNDLSALVGTGNLKHIIIDRAQLMQLAEALAGELDVTFGDERRTI